jgi:hypothetical protein
LLVAPCDYKAAKYAVEHWHYSGSMPTPPVVKYGVWENGRFIGAVLFSRGNSNNLGKPYQLNKDEVCELTRVALDFHISTVTQIVAQAIKLLRMSSPGLRLIISFADPEENHTGVIYQAGNWIYSGQSSDDSKFIDVNGRVWHSRQVSATGVKKQYGEYRRVPKISDCVRVDVKGKHRYLYPLDRALRRQITPLAQPYPKKEDMRAANGSTPASSGDKAVRSRPVRSEDIET